MLTPLDQPLDKLEDLTAEEMSECCFLSVFSVDADTGRSFVSENMKGWTEHFSNKYIICGRLVEDDAAI